MTFSTAVPSLALLLVTAGLGSLPAAPTPPGGTSGGTGGYALQPYTMPADTTDPGLMHVVHFWLDPELSADDREAFLAGVRGLSEIPTVRELYVGAPAATPSRGVVDNSFDYALVVWFDDVAGHDAYQDHPIHVAFVEAHEAKFARVRVRDSEEVE